MREVGRLRVAKSLLSSEMGNRMKQKTFSALIANRQVRGSSPRLGSN
jgi:hypothetical protein